MTFEGVCPIFRVADLAASLAYYVDILGFAIDWRYPTIASVTRDRCTLFLSVGDQGNVGGWVWIGVSDAEELHADYVARGAVIRVPPTNYPWALEMHVSDPDGNVLRFGSDAKEGVPFGEWLDMYGKRWTLGR